jgi:hypothetical protein
MAGTRRSPDGRAGEGVSEPAISCGTVRALPSPDRADVHQNAAKPLCGACRARAQRWHRPRRQPEAPAQACGRRRQGRRCRRRCTRKPPWAWQEETWPTRQPQRAVCGARGTHGRGGGRAAGTSTWAAKPGPHECEDPPASGRPRARQRPAVGNRHGRPWRGSRASGRCWRRVSEASGFHRAATPHGARSLAR